MLIEQSTLEGLSELNLQVIERLAELPTVPQLPPFVPIKGQAAVAVILFQTPSYAHSDGRLSPSKLNDDENAEYEPELQVLCTTRAMHLSSHPGQASLPGGKVDRSDRGQVIMTAFRETCEEIGLPSNSLESGECVLLGMGRPFISKTTLLVHPVLFFLPPKTCNKTLSKLYASPDEVSALWSHPLRAFLSSNIPRQLKKLNGPLSTLQESGEPLFMVADPKIVDIHRKPQEVYRTFSDVPWLLGGLYRLHRFRTSHQLIKGLTADILIHVASHAYGPPYPKFTVFAPTQASWDDCVEYIIRKHMSNQANGNSRKGPGRWGDGESGDSYGSMHQYDTIEGVDWQEEDSQEIRERDSLFVKRELAVNWMRFNGTSSTRELH